MVITRAEAPPLHRLGGLRRLGPLWFLMLTLVSMLIVRGAIIVATPEMASYIDLSIYREVGQLVLHGVNPYDFAAQSEVRERLRTDGVGASGGIAETRESYDYYTSANLPGSTLLYAALEWASGGNPVWWRVAFLCGDLLIALGAGLLMARAGAELRSVGARLGFFAVLVAYFTLLRSGTWVPEDKQFETGLLLLVAAWLLPRPEATRRWSAAGAGGVWACSILFKAFGVVLLPLVVRHFVRRPARELVWFVVGFLVVAVAIVWRFSDSFITLIARRAYAGSVSGAAFASPWILLPWPAALSWLKPMTTLVAIALLGVAYARKRLDLLNVLAGILLCGICIWITTGSMDRMNITMVFACFCLATLVGGVWWKLAVANTAFQWLLHLGVMLRGPLGPMLEWCDAVSTVFFVLSYFVLIWFARAGPSAPQASPASA
jgi:hypothetical protein